MIFHLFLKKMAFWRRLVTRNLIDNPRVKKFMPCSTKEYFDSLPGSPVFIIFRSINFKIFSLMEEICTQVGCLCELEHILTIAYYLEN